MFSEPAEGKGAILFRMNALSEFVITERDAYVGKDSNLFAFSLGQAIRYYDFILIIVRRYEDISREIISHSTKMKALLSTASSGTATIEQMQLLEEMSRLSTLAHLEIESFYVFAKIFLDKLAFFYARLFRLGK